jgi:hypothetical protein
MNMNAHARFAVVLLAGLAASSLCQAQQQDPTPRKDIDPWDRSQVMQAQAKRWLIGAQQQQPQDTRVLASKVGSKTCITNVGTTTQQPQAPGSFTPRYGPAPGGKQNRVVVVNGSVINVCK